MGEFCIETRRLVLRRFRDADRAPFAAHLNTPQVRAHLGGVVSAEAIAEKFARQCESWDDATGGWLAIERRSDGKFLGTCGFGPIAAESAPDGLRGAPEIGWTLRADAWGQGYATEAAAVLIDAVFGQFRHHRLFSQTSEANRASWRVMERLGLQRMAALDYVDPAYPRDENPTKVYGLTREQWQERPK